MHFDIASIRAWLLGTVFGVILLGAVGSVFGSIVWILLRSATRKVMSRWNHFLLNVAYRRFRRHIEIAEKVRARYGAEAKSQRYVLFVLTEVAGMIFETIVAVAAVLGTSAIAVAYGIDRPILLVVAISISFPLALQCLRTAVFVTSLIDESVDLTRDEIESSQPKRYRDTLNKGGRK